MLRSFAFALTAGASLVLSISAFAETPAVGLPRIKAGVIKAPIVSNSDAVTDAATPPPAGTPCTVTLFSNFQFVNFNAQYFTYTPSCPGPWSRVIFNGSFAITPGIQYDRTAEISLGYVNIYFGTTREDDPSFGPTWNVTRDLTDYTPLFTAAQPGEVDLGNLVNSQYTGVISGTATLSFYPVAAGGAAPVVADAVYPYPDAPGGAVALDSTTSVLSQTYTFPTNIESAYLDVFAQSQSNDEFWWSCAPNDVAGELEDCGNTAFRETEITIDGTPAGVAPVYPWIYTGGIDPNLWLPIPGVQTLNFLPYRVDLTPFAATLSNGQPHTVGLSVYNADDYFAVTATLLVYEDHGSTAVTGATTTNTIGNGPNPVVNENITIDSNDIPVGTIVVTSDRQFTISGYVNTSHGKVTTTLNQTVNFSNLQNYTDSANLYKQTTFVNSTKTVTQGSITQTITTQYTYPLKVTLSLGTASNGDEDETITAQQSYDTSTEGPGNISTALTQSFAGADTQDLITGEDLAQESSYLQTNTRNNSCTQTAIRAKNDSATYNKSGPCTN
ncbi:MAG: peptide-N4-asparagine amidase [Bryobacteraceae bacterium]